MVEENKGEENIQNSVGGKTLIEVDEATRERLLWCMAEAERLSGNEYALIIEMLAVW